MQKCQWNECSNKATKEVSRIVHDNVQKIPNTYSSETETIVVCDEHLEEARKEYPEMVNDIP